MRIFNIIFLLFVNSFYCSSQHLHFRTDGYYVFDNKCDTLYLADKDDKDIAEIKNQITHMGLKWNTADACVPKGELVLGGGSAFDVIAFFTDSTGFSFTHTCWDSIAYKSCVASILLRKNKIINEQNQCLKVSLHPDNSFIEVIPPYEYYYSQLKGRLYSDSIVLTKSFNYGYGYKRQLLPPQSGTYKFYRFDQSPPKRDKLIIVYKKPEPTY